MYTKSLICLESLPRITFTALHQQSMDDKIGTKIKTKFTTKHIAI